MIDFEWILTAAHCASFVDEGKVCMYDSLRVRVPIAAKWDDVKNSGFKTRKPLELFDDITVPILENVTIFVYKRYLRNPTYIRGADIALIRIPKIPRPQRLPFQLLSGNSIQSVTVVGFPFVAVPNISQDLSRLITKKLLWRRKTLM